MYDKWTVPLLIMLCILMFGGCNQQAGDRPAYVQPNSGGQQLASSQEIIIHFTGTVKSINLLGKKKVLIIPVHFDPRYALTLHIDSVQEEKVPLEASNTKVFGIHSPSKLFAEPREQAIGKTYDFEVTWTISPDNEWGFQNLRADSSKQLRILDDNINVYYIVEKDREVLSAIKNGEERWSSNIIKMCGKPLVGTPKIRHIELKEDKIVVTFGKHDFASVDARTGKVTYLGSD